MSAKELDIVVDHPFEQIPRQIALACFGHPIHCLGVFGNSSDRNVDSGEENSRKRYSNH